ncbi:GntR family transcriptional regulator [Salinibacterium sp. ZJ454]|uniref:GntR family transcriptional regulator n=1 Tax=Salinibacterium sp. ZJ454 TaxID=2708339 RepID=UPI001423AE9A|nr:GntR family transcriptional regulator [Salinibacterium sp. ZJ454]
MSGEHEGGSLGARASLSEEVARAMRTLILNGEVAAGDFLRIDEMASRLGTSHTPVREALMTLKVEGFVESEPRKGFRVLPLAPEDIDDAFSVLAYLSGEINARAAARITANELADLRQLHERASDATPAEIPDLNTRFHHAIYATARAPKIRMMIFFVSRYTPTSHMAEKGWKDATRGDHEALLVALEKHDAAEARRIGISHVNLAHAALIELSDRSSTVA